ncbi:MAG: succinate dehydrogenase iron-sulfur subunit [Spirochaeta sp. LUC14_002_19_P3]|nr:MAG: succinate dehydrogenase iron-sulfur subunit [Spirochaeta sp. LUC14_002_19_P3]
MNVILDINRFDPERDSESRRERFEVCVEPTDRVLDALIHISRYEDGTLAFRKSCAHGICGSDAMRINGKERLACKTLIRDVAEADGDIVTLDPLNHFPVQKDLMVDQSEFLARFRAVEPYLNPKEAPPPNGEFYQSAQDRALIDDATKCINCGACYSACPKLDENPYFLGPAALVAAARFVFDSRDKGLDERLKIVDDADAIWSCDNHFDCTRVCPREIKITKLINLMKRTVNKYKEGQL